MIDVVKKKRAPRKKPELSVLICDDLPEAESSLQEFTAVGLVRGEGNDYFAATVKISGGKAEIIDAGYPNLKRIALDDTRIAFQKRVIDAASF